MIKVAELECLQATRKRAMNETFAAYESFGDFWNLDMPRHIDLLQRVDGVVNHGKGNK